jgi:hypothetical protein
VVDRPIRVQLSRLKGWRKPDNTVVVSRPSRWGNPYDWREWIEDWKACRVGPVEQGRDWCQARAVQSFKDDIEDGLLPDIMNNIAELRGKNLACWCKPGTPCHADTLLEIANR